MYDTQAYLPHETFYTHETFMGGFEQATGSLGPHTGYYVNCRHRSHQDRRRLDFRALAVTTMQTQGLAEKQKSTKMPITYFKEYALDEGFDDMCLELDFADEEDERGIDIVDVMSVTFPMDPDPMSGRPMLSSLRNIATHLPKQSSSLHELRIPRSRLFQFIKLLLLVQLRDLASLDLQLTSQSESLDASAKCITNSFTNGEDIAWEAFDEVIKRNLVRRLLFHVGHN